MKCYLCDKEFEEGELWVTSKNGSPYHLYVQDCNKKQKGE